MSEDYKKIALEDVKKGQRIRVVMQYKSHIATYEGEVVRPDIERGEIEIGVEGNELPIYVVDSDYIGTRITEILLLEDAPKPKVVRTETVVITHYDDGTTTQAPVEEEVRVPTAINTMEQFGEYEDYLKQVILKDREGDYWSYLDGHWCWTCGPWLPAVKWCTLTDRETIEQSLPLTVVGEVGD